MLKLDDSSGKFYASFEEGIQLSEDIVSSITAYVLSPLSKGIIDTKSDRVQWYASRNWHFIFSLKNAPSLIFRGCRNNEITEMQYSNMLYGRTVCRTHNLGLLVIPNAKKLSINFQGKPHTFIVERKPDAILDPDIQEKLFAEYADNLNEVIRQLAEFICVTGYSDVDFNKFCVLSNSRDRNANYKIALVNIGEMNDSLKGLFGNTESRGLLRCVMPSQQQVVIDVAKKHMNLSEKQNSRFEKLISHVDNILASRRMEVHFGNVLAQFHKKNNIVKGNEPLSVDLESLGFSGDRLITAQNVLGEINKQIANQSDRISIKHQRCVVINKAYSKDDNLRLATVVDIFVHKKIIFNVIKEDHCYFKLQV